MITLLIAVFVLAYFAISLEAYIHINKASIALVSGVLCWTVYIISSSDKHIISEELSTNMGELSGILFFLLSAMTVVELIDAHGGFDIITLRINQTRKRPLVWTISLITFFLSPILDNLTTSIVMVLLLRKLIDSPKQRLIYVGMVIIAANAGGIWSPMGDVTTTMLWIGNQITAKSVIYHLFLPSLICLLVPLTICSLRMKGIVRRPSNSNSINRIAYPKSHQYLILISGLLVLLSVPIFKTLTGLPPFMGILIGLGVLWIITEIIHRKTETDQDLTVAGALQRIDSPSILFFLGILLSIAALESAGVLHNLQIAMSRIFSSQTSLLTGIGILSSIVDNVPLVAASQAMYSLQNFPTDDTFWRLLAYTTGSGGSILLIGSAAGVAAMGMEKISFGWYLKKITPLALLGYFAGIAVYLLQEYLLN